MFHLLDRIYTIIARILHNEPSITAANPALLSGVVNSTPYLQAYTLLNDVLTKVESACTGGEQIPSCDVYTKSPLSKRNKVALHKKRKAAESHDSDLVKKVKRLERELERAKSAKGATTPKREPASKAVYVGAIKVLDKAGKIKFPDKWPEGVDHICAPCMKMGGAGCTHKNCKWSHNHPKKWNKDTTKFMIDLVNKDKNLCWNPEVMTSELLELKYNVTKAPAPEDDEESK
jgi:hypothetical protein